MFAIYLAGLVVGSASLVSSSRLAIQNGYWQLVIIYLMVYSWAIVITFVRRMNFHLRAWSGLLLFYVLGLAALFTGGPGGSGRLWLFALSIVACLFLGLRAGVLTLILNAATVFFSGWLMSTGFLEWPVITPSVKVWAVGGITFVFLSTVVTVSLAVLVRFLEKSLTKEQGLTAELVSTNKELQREISTRKRTEEMLRLSEERYHGILNACHDSILVFEADSGVLFANDAWHDKTGYTPDDMKSMQPLNIIYPDDFEEVASWMQKLLAGEPVREIQYRRTNKDGEVRWVESNADPVGWQDISTAFVSVTRDITERKQAESALEESEEKLRALLNACIDTAILVDANGTILTLNETAAGRLGKSVEQLIGVSAYDMVPPEVAERRRIRADEVIRTGAPVRFEDQRDEMIFDNNVHPVFDDRGQVSKLAIYAMDITEQRRAEETLRESEERWRSLVENAPDIIIMTDREGKILFINRTIPDLNVEDVIGTHLLDYIPPEQHKKIKESIERVLRTGNPDSYEILGYGSNNTLSWYATRIGPIKHNGEVVAVILITRDITDQKRAEEALRRSEEKYRTLFEESHDVVYVTTPEGKVLDINPAGIELFGYSSKEEHLSINIPEDSYVNPESRKTFQQEIAERGYVRDYELELKKKNGEKVQVLISANAVRDEDGSIAAYQGIMHDITERKRLEFQVQQSSKLAALGELAAGVAHEINNPLAVIDVQAGLIRDTIEEGEPIAESSARKDLKEKLYTIEDQVQRCQSITENLLSFVRKPPDRTEMLDVNDLLRATLKFVFGLADKKPDIELTLDKQLPWFRGNAHLLQQVFVNLLNNALKAIDPDGHVAITSNLDEKSNICIKFWDSGEGIAPEIKDRIFEPFFTTRPPGEGTGLGLSLSFYIIKQMDGTLEVESLPGQGTTVTITLPVYGEKASDTNLLN